MRYQQTADWWRAPFDESRTNADAYLWELADAYGDVTKRAWGLRRETAIRRFPEVTFKRLETGQAAKRDHVFPAKTADDIVEQAVEHDRETARLQDEVKALRSRYKKAVRDSNIYDDLAAEGRAVLSALTPHCAYNRQPKRDNTIRQALVLNFADWHVDETVDAEIMEGLNFYDPPTALRRLETAVDKTLLIANLSDRITFDTLYIHDFGDNCTNGIHEDAKATNSMSPLKGARFAATMKAYAIRDLAPHFERVVFRGVPGNHGRFTKGMPWKQPTENLDWLVYQWTKTMCADIGNVVFEIPEAWSMTAEVAGWGFFLNHGTSDAKGGFGGISWYSLQKSDTKRTSLDVKLNRKVLVRQYGHMHQQADVERAGGNGRIRIEPSMKGGDEFPKEGMAGTYSEPAQSLLEVHPTEGLVAERTINIRQRDTEDECRYDPILALV